jgi:hypothetical protein
MALPKTIIDGIRQQGRGLASFAKANPRLGLSALGVSLAAPLFLKNDERGYLQTSVITTPLVAAGMQVAPSVFAEAQRQGSRIKGSLFSIPARMKAAGHTSAIKTLQDQYASKLITLEQFTAGLNNVYKARVSVPDLTHDSASLRASLQKIIGNQDLHSYISNAIHAEKLRTLSAGDLRSYLRGFEGLEAIAPMLGEDAITSAINTQVASGNIDFVRGMNARMQAALTLKDPGGRRVARENMESAFESLSWKDSSVIRTRLQEYRPDLFGAIAEQIKAKNLDPQHLSVLRLRNQPINPIVALKYKDDLMIPIVDDLGAIRTGNRFQNVGVSRQFYNASEIMKSDVYAVRHLHHGTNRVAEELGRSNILGLHIDPVDDPLTSYSNWRASSPQIALRSRQTIPAHLGNGFLGNNFTSLDPAGQEGAFINAVQHHGGTKVGSEAGVADYIFETGDTENLALFGRVNVERQNDRWRAFAKPVQLSDTSAAPVPFTTTDFFNRVSGGQIKPREFGTYAASLSPQQRSIFGDLRSVADLTSESVVNRSIDAISSDAKISRDAAKRVWQELSKELSNPKVLQAMSKTQYLGEGGHLMPHNLHGLKTEYTQGFDVHELRLKDFSPGTVIDKNTIIGYHNGNPLRAEGTRNIIESVSEIGDGMMRVSVKQQFPFGTGAKIDGLVKGLVHTVSTGDFKTIRRVLNKYHKLAGTGGFIPENVKALTLFNYVQDKADPVNMMMNTAASTLRELEGSGLTGQKIVSQYAGEFEHLGLSYQNGGLQWNSASNAGNPLAKEEQIKKAQGVVEKMMADVGERVKFHQIQVNEYLREFARSPAARSASSPDELGNALFRHMSQYNQAFNARVWDHSLLFAPHDATATFDILQDLSMRGLHGAASDIHNRLRFDGDLRMNRRMEDFLAGNKGAITNTISLQDAMGGMSLSDARLGTAGGREGTIFDPGHAGAKDNFLLDLGNGKTVPVLGHDAFGAKVNRYGTGEFSANEVESGLMDLIKTNGKEGFADAESGYMARLNQLNYGKEGYRRAEAVDQLGTGKFITHHSSSLRYENGDVNPFEITVGRDMLKHISDEGVRNSLNAGEDVYAALARHPVSYVPMVKVRLNRDLTNTNLVGIDEGIRGLMMADQDKDMLFAYFFQQGSAGFKEAHDAVHNPESLQHIDLSIQHLLENGADDVARLAWRNKDIQPKNVMDRIGETFGKFLPEALRRRTASGAIGAFSNTETKLAIALEHNDVITDVATRSKLKRVLFTAIRQTPISAAKMKNEQGRLSFSEALGLNRRLNRSFRPGSSFEEFHSVMQEFGKHSPKGIADYINTEVDVLRDFHRGIRTDALELGEGLVASAQQTAKRRGSGAIPDLMPYVSAATKDVQEASMGAKMSAEALGAANTASKSLREVVEAAKGHGASKVLGLGLAAAAVAGVLTGRVRHRKASFSVPSSNSYRPEERMGVDGHVPGEPNAGAMAPSNPPRSIRPAPQGVRTAVVAPMQQSTDVDVQMRAPDRSRSAEVTRTISKMTTDGDSNLTINYRDGSHLGRLRTKERIREVLDQ